MSIPIRYQIEVAGADQMRRIVRSIEKEAQASAKRGATATRAADREVIRSKNQLERDAARAEAGKLRNLERFERQKIRIQNASFAMEQRMRDKSERSAIASANRKAKAEQRAAQQAQRARVATVSSMQRGAGRIAGGVGRGLAMGGSLLGIGGGILATNAVTEDFAIQRGASQLANQAGRPGIKGQLAREARSVRGFSGEEALAGMTSFVDVTGDLGAARGLIKDMGAVALATGTELTDLGGAMGNAFIPIADKIQDPVERLEKMREVMRAVAGMGAVGAVEIKDLASEMAGLAATSNRFQGNAQRNLELMTAMAQAARQRGGAASAAEAVTSVQRFSSDVVKRAGQKRLNQLGVNVFADKGKTQLRDPREILADVLEATGGDLSKLTGVFGEYGIRAVQGFSPLFTEAERQQKGSGRAAVMAEFDRLLQSSVSQKAVGERVASRLEDPDLVFKEASKGFNEALSSELTPAVTRFMKSITEAMPLLERGIDRLGDAIDFFADNPVAGVGVVVGGAITKEIQDAAIGEAVKSALTKSIPTPSGGRAGGGVNVDVDPDSPAAAATTGGTRGGRKSNFAGAGITGLAVGLPVAEGIFAQGVATFESSEAEMTKFGRKVAAAEAGELTPQEIREAQSELIRAQTKAAEPGMFESALKFGIRNLPLGLGRLMPEEHSEAFARKGAEFVGARNEQLEPFLKDMGPRLDAAMKPAIEAQVKAAEAAERAAKAQEASAGAGGNSDKRNNPIVKRGGG